MAISLIDMLVEDLPKQKTLASARSRWFFAAMSQILIVGLFAVFWPKVFFHLDLALIAAAMLVSSYATVFLSVPGEPRSRLLALTSYAAILIWGFYLLWSMGKSAAPYASGEGCAMMIGGIGIASAIPVFYALRGSYLVRPRSTMVLSAFSSLLVGAGALQIICPGSALHFFLWHFLPVPVVGLIVGYGASFFVIKAQRRKPHGI